MSLYSYLSQHALSNKNNGTAGKLTQTSLNKFARYSMGNPYIIHTEFICISCAV